MSQTAAPLALTDDDRAELGRWSQGRLPWLAERARATLARHSGLRDPGNVDTDQLARYQDAFRRYDIATLVGMIRVEASQAAS